MKKPILIINTDDEISMNSELRVTIHKPLGRFIFEHEKQYGTVETIQIFPSQVDDLVKFLKEGKVWIESGYKSKLRPESNIEGKIF